MNNISPDDQARIDAIEKALLARWPETRIAPTLDRISALVDILGSPQLSYPTIHVGGTNGKTTTTRMRPRSTVTPFKVPVCGWGLPSTRATVKRTSNSRGRAA